jgi:DnaK suppressor protein
MAAKKRPTAKHAKSSHKTSSKKPVAVSKKKAHPAKPVKRLAPAKSSRTPAVKAKKAAAPTATARPTKNATPVRKNDSAARSGGAASAQSTITAISAQRSAVKRPIGPILPVRPSILRKRDIEPLTSSVGLIHGIPPYQAKSGETYMNERQLKHFRNILLAWKKELMEEVDRTVHHMQDEASNFPDPNDRATQESEFGLELRTRDRERKLLKKIDSALERIDDGSYGYCEETGEEIGLRRLEARPVATLSVEAQERREMAERQFSDREDAF